MYRRGSWSLCHLDPKTVNQRHVISPAHTKNVMARPAYDDYYGHSLSKGVDARGPWPPLCHHVWNPLGPCSQHPHQAGSCSVGTVLCVAGSPSVSHPFFISESPLLSRQPSQPAALELGASILSSFLKPSHSVQCNSFKNMWTSCVSICNPLPCTEAIPPNTSLFPLGSLRDSAGQHLISLESDI